MEFKTIRQVASTGLIAEHRLRVLVKQGKCPGYYAGTRFWVDVDGLTDLLRRVSAEGGRL